MTEAVHPAMGYDFIQPLPFNGQKARDVFVLFGAGKVDLFVGGIEIPRYQDRFPGLAFCFHHLQRFVVKTQFIIQPGIAHSAIGEIDIEEDKMLVFGDVYPTLGVKFFHPKGILEADRLQFAE